MEPKDSGEWVRELSNLNFNGQILLSEPLGRYTSFGIGGPAEALVFPADLADLKLLLKFVRENKIPMLILGAGSNLLIRDGGFKGLVINLCLGFKQIKHEEHFLYAQSGAHISKVLAYAQTNQLSGLEFLVGVPGTIGGTVIMNAGAHENEVGKFIRGVMVLDFDGNVKRLKRSEINFEYRKSSIDAREIVLEAEFELMPADSGYIAEKMREYLARRKSGQPGGLSAGSIFKNPPGQSAGRIIESAGLKGTRIGGAEIAGKHANFILNTGAASAADVESLIQLVQREVLGKQGIKLEPEVKIIGQDQGGNRKL